LTGLSGTGASSFFDNAFPAELAYGFEHLGSVALGMLDVLTY
jgi:hypothetical protein